MSGEAKLDICSNSKNKVSYEQEITKKFSDIRANIPSYTNEQTMNMQLKLNKGKE